MVTSVSSLKPTTRTCYGLAALVLALACLRLTHVHLLWADEDYHLAAALFWLKGKVPYRDFWYDKPPLTALYYTLIGAQAGWPLRLLDAAFVIAACAVAFRFAKEWWGPREGWAAALLLAFFTAFDYPSSVISFAPDAIMLLPHFAAMRSAGRRRWLRAGAWCGIALLVNTKAIFVLAACVVWIWPFESLGLLWLVCGFAAPLVLAFAAALASGAWPGYLEQVWRWGLFYSRHPPAVDPAAVGAMRTLDWVAFHAALLFGAALALRNASSRQRWMLWRNSRKTGADAFAESRTTASKSACALNAPPQGARSFYPVWRRASAPFALSSWMVLSFVAVGVGARFFPHYYLQLLPPVVIAGSRGLVIVAESRRKAAIAALAVLLAIPAIRFGSRQVRLAWDDFRGREPQWRDVVLDLDSRHVAEKIGAVARDGDSLFVWGYRSDIYIYTRMMSDSRFWDSQPLTGVPADRHLFANFPTYGGAAASNRRELAHSRPTFLVDGLGVLNPKLRPQAYPDLLSWLAQYRLIDRTGLSLIYRRID